MMIWKIVLVLVVAISVQGEEDAVSEQRVVLHHQKQQKQIAVAGSGEAKEENHKDYAESYPSYEFFYKVKDPHTHDIKGQHEERDGDKVKGDYWLIEPTGRKRTVKYHADDHIGFNAHVDFTENGYPLVRKDEIKNEEINKINGQNYEVTEIIEKEEAISLNSEGNENNNEKENIEIASTEGNKGNEENETKNQEENTENENNNLMEENVEQNENENKEPMNVENNNNEALNINSEANDGCKCNERRKKNHGSQVTNARKYNNEVREIGLRNKRRNNDRNVNAKKRNTVETRKNIETTEGRQRNQRKSRQNIVKKSVQTENIDQGKKEIEGSNYGKRKQDTLNQNEDESKYQHRILIHHPKNVKTLSSS